jgi:ribosomal protein L31
LFLFFPGTSQIRRLRLPRIADATGNLSYEELVGLVVTFHFPEGSPEKFKCSLTYFDEDEDTVTIASNDELVDAVEQFADKKVLRISTEVKPNTSPAATPRPAASAAQPPEASGNRTDRGTSTAADPDIHPQIQNVLDTVVGVLVTAVNSIEKGLSVPPAMGTYRTRTPAPEEKPKATETFANKKVEKPAAVSPPNMVFAVGNAGTKPVTAFVHSRHTCDSCLKTPVVGKRYHAVNQVDYDLCENCFKTYSGKQTHFIEHPSEKKVEKFTKVVSKPAPPKEAAKAPEPPAGPKPEPTPAPVPEQEEEEEEENLTFIHGRHTCDSCLKTPILGKRMHATNIKNFDMCASCHDNYSGTEIQFEAVELRKSFRSCV